MLFRSQDAAYRVTAYVEVENEKTRQDAVDLLAEERERVLERSPIYQQDLRRYHARRVRTRTFQEGDLVLRWTQPNAGMHKLTPPWEGPFIVSKKLHNGSYYLVDAERSMSGKLIQIILLNHCKKRRGRGTYLSFVLTTPRIREEVVMM